MTSTMSHPHLRFDSKTSHSVLSTEQKLHFLTDICPVTAKRSQETFSSMSKCTYQVSLSSGDDTSINFSDHLYTALVRSGIHTHRADDGIERGRNMQSEFERATEESRISVIVFSKGYASSGWCLDELLNVLQRRKAVGHKILPVYYNVDPSEVGKQTGSFGEAFANHEEQFIAATEERRKDLMENVERWRAALREVAKLRGMVLQNQSDG